MAADDFADPSDAPITSGRRGRFSPRHLMLGVAAGLAIGALAGFAALTWSFRESAPLVTEETLAEAEARWRTHGPKSYRIDLTLGGTQSGRIEVEVRDGQVTHMTRDGRTPNQRRTWEYWSIPNQFEMIRQDLASRKSPQKAFGVTSPEQVTLRAEFDPEFGYPRLYRRSVSGGSYDVEWRNERFESLDDGTR